MRKLIAVIAISSLAFLQGCCIWGFQTNERNGWEPRSREAMEMGVQAQEEICQSTSDMNACMKQSGFVWVEKKEIACRPLSFF